jgi:hypothetical protein
MIEFTPSFCHDLFFLISGKQILINFTHTIFRMEVIATFFMVSVASYKIDGASIFFPHFKFITCKIIIMFLKF